MTVDDVQRRLDELLSRAGCRSYRAADVRQDAQAVWREIYADAVAHGDGGDEPFFNFVAVEGAAVFAFYGPTVELFVLAADEADLREQFDPLAMREVRRARRILATRFNKPEPDLTMDGPLGADWLGPREA